MDPRKGLFHSGEKVRALSREGEHGINRPSAKLSMSLVTRS